MCKARGSTCARSTVFYGTLLPALLHSYCTNPGKPNPVPCVPLSPRVCDATVCSCLCGVLAFASQDVDVGNILRGVLTCVRQHSVRVDVEYATLILNILCLDSMGKVRKRRPACRGPRESSCFGTVRPALELPPAGQTGILENAAPGLGCCGVYLRPLNLRCNTDF